MFVNEMSSTLELYAVQLETKSYVGLPGFQLPSHDLGIPLLATDLL